MGEKSQIQALDRTTPILPLQPGLAERRFPRLRPARPLDPIRRAGDRHRQRRMGVQTKAPAPGGSGLPQVGGLRQPQRRHRAAAAPGDGQLRPGTSTAPSRPGWRRTLGSSDFSPAHASWMDLVVVWFSLDRTPSHPPRHLRLRPRPLRQDPRLHRGAGTTVPTFRGTSPPTNSSPKPTDRRPQTRGSRWGLELSLPWPGQGREW